MQKLCIFICFSLIAVRAFGQPANDNCAGATTVTPNGTCVSGTTVGAADSWQGSVGCQGGGNHPDVWYRFVSTGTQAQFNITTSAPWSGNVEVVLVEGACTTGFTIVGSQCGASPINTTFNGLQAGNTYYYTISNANGGTPGPFQVCVTTSSPPTLAGQDCSSAAILCNSSAISQPTSNAGFGIQEVNQANSCWITGGERQSKWYKFTVGCSGTLEFNIRPNVLGNDYDWALWNVTSDPAGCTTKGNRIACNWSACTGSTGMSSCAPSESGANNGGPGCMGNFAAWNTPISVMAGNTYALLVDNFTTSNNGFALTFGGACSGGTAVIGPDASFTYTIGTCGTYNFTKTCPTSNSTFLWQFGDGSTATTQNASHTYTTFGNFVITLAVTDALGCVATFSQTINIVSTAPPTVTSPMNYCVGTAATPLSAVGTNLLWYTSASGGVGTATAPTPSTGTAGTTSYYVSQNVGGCESPRAQINVIVTPAPTVSVNSTTICAGQSTTLTATPSVGGGTYSWSPGGQTTPSITVSPVTTTLYTVTYSIGGCSNNGSGTINVTTVTPSVSIAASSTTICTGTSVTFTATPTNGGANPTYQWQINGVNVPGQTGATFTSTTLANGNVVTVVMTSNAPCANPVTASSNAITIIVNTVTPGVSIAASSTTICPGTSVTFTATPTNGGANPTYQWQINAVNVPGQTGVTFTSTTLANGNVVTVVMTSNAPCANPVTASSNAITITVNTITPTVSIAASSTTICIGTSVTFTATPINGGANPTYQWQINGVNVPGQTGATFTSTTLANGNVVTVVMTSNAPCANPVTATSNAIPIIVNTVTPTVSIAASSTTICTGTSVTFTATPTNGGANPTYQWQINGVNVPGQTGVTFTSTTLANGNVVTVVMTSNAPCANPVTASSNAITITVNTITPTVSIAASSTTICIGTSVTFTATPTNGGANPTYQWQINGVNVPGQTGVTFTSTTLANGNVVTVVMTSNAPCANPVTASSNAITITVNTITPTVSIAASSTTICTGTSVTFTATPTNGGANPTYQWQINAVNVPGQTGATFTSTTLANGNVVTVVMTSNAPCAIPVTATSNVIPIIVTTVTPTVSIAASSTTICTGTSVTFTATPTNGGANPTYQWQINGVNVPGQTGVTFTSTTLANGNVVTVVMTSNAPCATPTTVSSNGITIIVTTITPSVSIAASSTTICTGTSVTFTATPTNGGANPTYQWQINGVNVPGQTGVTFTSTTLANGNVVTVVMTSNAPCATPTTVSSNGITIIVTTVTPSVSIAASSTTICTGTSVTFTANPINGGANPTYQWQINGVNVPGQTGVTFTSTTLANGNVVTVVMTSNAPCANPVTASSNAITITVNTITPTVSIAASSTTICTGTSVTFTATPTNGGANPTYQWQINGVNVPGQTGATFTSTTLANGNMVTVVMTSNSPCANPVIATSNAIPIIVTTVTPTVSIAASSTTICTGTSVTFTATPTNGGANPTYQWQINGVNVPGQTGATFTSTTLANGNVVTVVMTSNAPCANPVTATSNAIPIIVTTVTPTVSIAASNTTICTGTSVTFTATPTNGGANPTYQWQINGVNVPGQTGATFTSSTLANGNVVTVVMTSNAPCANPVTATSNAIPIIVTTVTPTVSIAASSTTICTGTSVTFTATPTNGGAIPTYQWQINGVNVPGQTSATLTSSTLANGNVVTVVMTSNDPCASPLTANSNAITITATSVTPSVTIAASSTSICTGSSVTFTATPTNGGANPTYQWQINGVNVPGQTSATFTSSSLANGNVVTVVMTSSDPCASPVTANSNAITITATSVTPSVTIAASSTSICTGTLVTFTATPINGGTTPTYQWLINGVNVPGQTVATFTSTTLANGNVVSVVMTSSDPCANPVTATSNAITITAASVTPTVTIATSSTSICTGTSVTFTATPTNGGATPTYQWQINGVNVPGQTAATFTSSSLANGNVVTVVMTSSDPCASPVTANSNAITITATSVTPSVTIAASSTSICTGTSVTFTATPINGGANPTYQWQINGVNVPGQTAATFTSSSLANGNVVTVVMTSSDPCASPVMANSNAITITAASVTPSVAITASSTSICTGSSVTFTATPTNGGATPTYQWQINGVNVPGQTGPTFTSTTLSNGNVVTVAMTSSDPCASPVTATSNAITITTASVTPSVAITASSTSICTGSSVTFTATPTNGGATPTYQWLINGVNVPGQTAATFTSTTLANGNVITAIMTSSDPCASPATVTSNAITITAASVTPTVTIAASITSICTGNSVTFTATPTNGGATPTYQWLINGVNVPGQTGPTFTSTTLSNGNVVTIAMTSSDPCASPVTASSNAITITTASVTPSVAITASSTSICTGSSVIFTATPTNGGTNPTYQWLINGVNVPGQTAATFTSTTLANGNVVTVVMTSSDPCATPVTATSNAITITAAAIIPTVTIAASSTSICTGTSVTFTATPTNAGTTPTYQWLINGVNVAGQNGATFTSSTLANGNVVSVMMTSSDPCASPVTVSSGAITITSTTITPSVAITASSTSICTGTSVTFTATPTNGGATPTYQWLINGVNVAGQNGATFTSTTLVNGNVVSVMMASSDPCASPITVNSNAITITSTTVTPSVAITASSTSICTGSSVTFTAKPTNGGTNPTYQWLINGINVAGQNGATFTSTTLVNGNLVTVAMTSSDPCASPVTVNSNDITITSTTVTPSVAITASSTSICTGSSVTFTATPGNGGTNPTYQWLINGVNVAGQTGATFTSTTLTNGNVVSVMMTSNDPCANPTPIVSNNLQISVGVPQLTINNPPVVCFPLTIDLTNTQITSGSDPGLSFSYWLDAAATIPLANPTAVGAGTYYIKGQAGIGCSVTKPVVVSIQNSIPGIRYTDQATPPNVPLPVQARSLGNNYIYRWSPSTGLNNADVKDPVFTYNQQTEYLITLTSPEGCITVDTLLVKILGPSDTTRYVFVPKAWSPNGDGHNDFLYPLTVNIASIKYFRIFNRWGNMVFETNNFGIGWDGKYKGTAQVMDVYIWSFEGVSTNGKIIKREGQAVLLR